MMNPGAPRLGPDPLQDWHHAFNLICRLEPRCPRSAFGKASSDLIGAWPHAPSQSCPLTWPARHPPGGRNDRSRRS